VVVTFEVAEMGGKIKTYRYMIYAYALIKYVTIYIMLIELIFTGPI